MTSNVQKIAEQVRELDDDEFDDFLAWLSDYESEHWNEWDREIERDSQPGGRLDSVIKRACEDIAAKCKP